MPSYMSVETQDVTLPEEQLTKKEKVLEEPYDGEGDLTGWLTIIGAYVFPFAEHLNYSQCFLSQKLVYSLRNIWVRN